MKNIIKVWGICMIAAIISLVFSQLQAMVLFIWIAACISCGSLEWFNWYVDITNGYRKKVEGKMDKKEKNMDEVDKVEKVEEKKEFVEKKETINCACGCDALVVATDNDFLNGMVEFAFWKYGHDNHRNFSNKCKNIWQMIRYGHPYSDMVILDKDGVDKLMKFLEESKIK